VVDAELRLIAREIIQRDVTLALLDIIEHRETMAKRAAPAILAREPHWCFFQQQRANRERLAVGPIEWTAILERVRPTLDERFLELRENLEAIRNVRERRTHLRHRFDRNRGWHRNVRIRWLKNRGRPRELFLVAGAARRQRRLCGLIIRFQLRLELLAQF